MQWFRMYSKFATDTKVQSMSETLQRRFTMFLCLQCGGEFERLDDEELALALRISTPELLETIDVFKRKGLLEDDRKIRSWNKLQFKSDDSTERVKRFRSRKVKRSSNGDVTAVSRPQSQRQIQIQKQKEEECTSAAPTRAQHVPRETPQWMLDFKLAYPERSGDPEWRGALRAANARIAEGHQPSEFIAGARRYAEYCAATQSTGTQFVMQAARFLGPSKPFTQDWKPPLTKAEALQERNIAATMSWLADEEAKDATG